VVEVGGAVGEDSLAVELPLFGVNGDGDGGNVNGGGELVNISGGDVNEGGDLRFSLGDLALLVNGLVGILVFGGDSVINDELETIVHKSSVATLVAVLGGAINELLFREGEGSLSGNGEGGFEGTGGGECPA